jgi:uncharacterized membrane-anchored protein YhcB (DUF1043 family)
MDDQVLELLKKKIEEERKAVVESLVDGIAKDYAEYQHLCGVIRGLLTAQREINDLLRKLKDSDDD